MSAVESPIPIAGPARPGSLLARARERAMWLGPLTLPLGVAFAYVVVLVLRYPTIIRWQNGDGDIATFYVMAGVLAHHSPGTIVQLATQGSWVQFGWMVLTEGLPFHRLLWELFVPAMGVAAVALISLAVSRIGDRRAALLTAALLAATSPWVLLCLTTIGFHNTTPLGTALLGGHLVWLGRGPRSRRAILASIIAVGLMAGVLLASDELLGVAGVVPYVIAAAMCARSGGRRLLVTAIETATIVVITSVALLKVMLARGIRLSTPGVHLDLAHAAMRAGWLVDGVLRLGNGRTVAPHSPWLDPLTVIAAAVVVIALVAMFIVTVRSHRRRGDGPAARARALHTAFWLGGASCSAVAYVFTNVAENPSDRYLVVVVLAVAATAPLLLENGRFARRATATAAFVYVTASLAALLGSQLHHDNVIRDGGSVERRIQIERIVTDHHLGRGYAGYWDAQNLDWLSDGRLRIAPVIGNRGAMAAMFIMQDSGWYQPRPHTPTYLLLAPHDPLLPDRLPSSLPRPAHIYHSGPVTIEVWPYDIAAWLNPSLVQVPGITRTELRRARAAELHEAERG